MKKIETIKSKDDFGNIIHNGKKIKNQYFTIFYYPSEETKYGIAIAKKIGNAVTRNKLKRIYRTIIDNNKLLFQKNQNYIIMIKRESLNVKYDVLNIEMKTLLEKVNK